MKMLLITSAYSSYLDDFYNKNPEAENQSYSFQKKLLDYDAFGWADFWSNALKPFGYDVIELLTNAEPLQKKWAEEQGKIYKRNSWLLDITRYQILHERPDILFFDDYSTFKYDWIVEIKRECPSVKLILGWCGAAYRDEKVFNAYDVVLSCIPELVEHFRKLGHRSEHLHHGFDPRILDRIDTKREPNIDFTFIGQVVRGNKMHIEREIILESLVKTIEIKIFSPSFQTNNKKLIKVVGGQILYDGISLAKMMGVPKEWLRKVPIIEMVSLLEDRPKLPMNRKLKKYMNPPVFGLDMFQKLHDSKITFNNHINLSPRSASNMRMWESTGVGACLVTDWKENLHELFEIDQEIITYKSSEECVEKVKWLIDNPAKRESIAKAGQERCLKEHTYEKRAVNLDGIIKKYI